MSDKLTPYTELPVSEADLITMEHFAKPRSDATSREVLRLIHEVRRLRDYLREKNEIIKAFADASGGMNPEELAYHFENHAKVVKT